MSILAQLMYQALVWKERQRARIASHAPSAPPSEAEHLKTGARGETLAYWYLRQAGYTIVARNRRARSGAGEIDMMGWDGPVLSFVEVKTRTTAEARPAGNGSFQGETEAHWPGRQRVPAPPSHGSR